MTRDKAAAAMHGAKRSNIKFSLSPAVRAAGRRGRRFLDSVAPPNSNTENICRSQFCERGLSRKRTLALNP
jgi:hypothetical protein